MYSHRLAEYAECQDASQSEHNRASFSDPDIPLLGYHNSSHSDSVHEGDPFAKYLKCLSTIHHLDPGTEASRQGMPGANTEAAMIAFAKVEGSKQ